MLNALTKQFVEQIMILVQNILSVWSGSNEKDCLYYTMLYSSLRRGEC